MATREEEVKVKVTGADQGARDLEKMGGTAKVAGESVKGMGREADKASKGVDELGDEAKQTASQLEKLEREVLQAKVALKALGDEYARTADKDVAKEFDKQSSALAKMESRLRSISKLNKELAPKHDVGGPARVAEIVGGGRNRRGGLLGSLLGGLDFLGQGAQKGISAGGDFLGDKLGDMGPMGALKLGVGISALPAVTSLAGSALLAGGAAAGVGLGVGGAIAANPEPFKKAWTAAIGEVSNRWQMASLGFQKPALESFAILKRAVDDIHIEQMLKSAEGYVVPLAKGIGGLVTGVGNGIAKLTEKAGPVVKVLEKGLPQIGFAIEKALGDIGDGAEGAGAALNDLFGYVSTGIRVFGKLVEGGEKVYGFFHGLVPLFEDSSAKAGEWTHHLGAIVKSTDNAATAQNNLSEAMKEVSDNISSQLDNLLALDKANDAAADGTNRLKEAFKENGNAITGSTEAAQKNREVLQDVIGDYLKQRDAAIAAGDGTAVSIGKANATLRQHLEDLRAILVAHGDDTSAVDKYIATLDALDGRVISVRVDMHWTGQVPPGVSLGNLLHHASGRSASAPAGWAVVGEKGPELAYFNQGDRVFPTGQSQAMLSAAPGYGSPAPVSPPTVRFAGNLNSAFATAFMQLVRAGLIQIS